MAEVSPDPKERTDRSVPPEESSGETRTRSFPNKWSPFSECSSAREKSARSAPLSLITDHLNNVSQMVQAVAQQQTSMYNESVDRLIKFQEEQALLRKGIRQDTSDSLKELATHLEDRMQTMGINLHEQQCKHAAELYQMVTDGLDSLQAKLHSYQDAPRPKHMQKEKESEISEYYSSAPRVLFNDIKYDRREGNSSSKELKSIMVEVAIQTVETKPGDLGSTSMSGVNQATPYTSTLGHDLPPPQEVGSFVQPCESLEEGPKQECSTQSVALQGLNTHDTDAWHMVMGWANNLDSDLRDKEIKVERRSSIAPSHLTDPSGLATHIFYSVGFNLASLVLTICNAVLIGIESNLSLKHAVQFALFKESRGPEPKSPSFVAFNVSDWLFCTWLLIEIGLGVFVLRKQYMTGLERAWNMFDVTMWVTAVLSVVIPGANLTYLRIIRIFRMIRVFRVVRIFKFVAGLRRMVISIYGGAMSLVWAFLLLCLLIFIFGVFLCDQISDGLNPLHVRRLHILSGSAAVNEMEAEHRVLHMLRDTEQMTTAQALQSRYGSLGHCMMTLLLSISGGDWGELARPLARVSEGLVYPFALYVMIMVFGILNVLTGAFVESAIEATATDRDNAIETAMQEKDSFVNKLKAIFEETDQDGSGQISFEEFANHLENEEVLAHLHSMGLETVEARGLFKLLDLDNSNSVNIDELISGCLRLKGQARAVDVATIIYENKRMMNQHALFSKYCRSEFSSIEESLHRIAEFVSAPINPKNNTRSISEVHI